MKQIKFSHRYEKLEVCYAPDGLFDPFVTLLDVLPVSLQDLSEYFLDYDTDGGKYKLPKRGRFLLLLFRGRHGMFTTLRSAFPQSKVDHYRGSIGEPFEIVINITPALKP